MLSVMSRLLLTTWDTLTDFLPFVYILFQLQPDASCFGLRSYEYCTLGLPSRNVFFADLQAFMSDTELSEVLVRSALPLSIGWSQCVEF